MGRGLGEVKPDEGAVKFFAHPHPLGAVAYDGCYPTNSSQGTSKQQLTTKILVIAQILLKFNNN